MCEEQSNLKSSITKYLQSSIDLRSFLAVTGMFQTYRDELNKNSATEKSPALRIVLVTSL